MDGCNRFPVRKNTRMKFYDYSTPNYYFVTICTKEKNCLFWNGQELNQMGILAREGFLQIPIHYPDAYVDKFVVMPNHVHAIIVLEKSDLSAIVGSYKSYVSKKIHEKYGDFPVWQVSFHDHVIRNQQSYEKIWQYIETNPIRWQEDCFYKETE